MEELHSHLKAMEDIQKFHGDKFTDLTEEEIQTDLKIHELAHILVQVYREQIGDIPEGPIYQPKRRGKSAKSE